MRLFLICPALLALAACGQQPTATTGNDAMNAAATAGNAANGGNVVAAITNLNEISQQAVFFRAIRDAGLQCQDVTNVERIDPIGGIPTWRARCDDGTEHVVQVKPDGNAVVISPTGS